MNPDTLNARAAVLALKHSGHTDCRVLAECEQSPADTLATFDEDFVKHLKAETPVFLGTPLTCWNRLAIPHGGEPNMQLQPQHPLFKADWWRW
jgi:hypothetical protein